MDGRDIGTCVLPDAPAKIYLTASVKVRAERRYKELTEKGIDADLREIERDIESRGLSGYAQRAFSAYAGRGCGFA